MGVFSKEKINKVWGRVLSIAVIVVFAAMTDVFLFMYVDRSVGYLAEHSLAVKIISTVLLSGLTAVSVVLQLKDKDFVVRLIISSLIFSSIVLSVVYALKVSRLEEKISSIEEFRDYISSFGGYAFTATFVMQFLQVVVLPVPGFVAVGAAVALFGPLKGALISLAGIWLGSVTGFFIGRRLGYKFAAWLVGKDTLDKWLLRIKGKDKAVLTLMFLLPFFPDDVLCFVSGLSSMSTKFFIIMMSVARIISVFTTAYSVDGSVIPYDTPFGIAAWALIVICTGIISFLVYKNGERIEGFFKKIFHRRDGSA